MRLLLDTHVILWWLADDPGLADDVKHTIDTEPDVFVSASEPMGTRDQAVAREDRTS